MTPLVFRLVPYKPCFHQAVLSTIRLELSLEYYCCLVIEVRMAVWHYFYQLSLFYYRLNNEKPHVLSYVVGSCYSEENRNDLVVFVSNTTWKC